MYFKKYYSTLDKKNVTEYFGQLLNLCILNIHAFLYTYRSQEGFAKGTFILDIKDICYFQYEILPVAIIGNFI